MSKPGIYYVEVAGNWTIARFDGGKWFFLTDEVELADLDFKVGMEVPMPDTITSCPMCGAQDLFWTPMIHYKCRNCNSKFTQ